MKIIAVQPNLVEQVHEAILQEISSGKLAPGTRIIQEQIAAELGGLQTTHTASAFVAEKPRPFARCARARLDRGAT